MSDFRPLSLLSTEYKVLGRILSHRLDLGLRHIVGNHQSYGFKGRSITHNLHSMRIICKAAKEGYTNLAVPQLDLSKASDMVDKNFLFSLIRHCELGSYVEE